MNSRSIKAIQKKLTDGKVYLVTSQNNLFYLTGVELCGYWLLVSKKEVIFIAPPLMKEQLEYLFGTSRLYCAEKLHLAYLTALKENRISCSLVDHGELSVALFNLLGKSSRILIDKENILAALRQIKTTEEIEIIRENQKVTKAAIRHASRFLKQGVTERKVASIILEYFLKNKGKPAFEPIVAFGANSAFPHHVTGGTRLKKNDVALIDAGFRRNGYCSDLTKTFILGKINSRKKKVFSIVCSAQKKAVASVKAGISCKEVDSAARREIARNGFEAQFIHSTGHGVGLDVHEKPFISGHSGEKLRENSVVTIEPGIYLKGEFGVRLEEIVVCKKNSCEVL